VVVRTVKKGDVTGQGPGSRRGTTGQAGAKFSGGEPVGSGNPDPEAFEVATEIPAVIRAAR
jgi:hypothetical protein